MALGNVFIKDVDGNIPYDTGSGNEKVTGLLFDVSLQPTLFTEGYGKTNESKFKLGDVCYITSLKSAINDFGIIERVWPRRRRKPMSTSCTAFRHTIYGSFSACRET